MVYNRYIPNGATYTRVVQDDAPPQQNRRQQQSHQQPQHSRQEQQHQHNRQEQQRQHNRQEHQHQHHEPSHGHTPPRSEGFGGLNGILESVTGLFKGLNLDSGDILLLLIMLFLFLEGDNTELVIALGLMFVMGLFEKED